MDSTQILTYSFAVLVIIALILNTFGLGVIVSQKAQTLIKRLKIEYKHVVAFTYAISMMATLGSLYYSDVAGYSPCKFCWYQRIMMYPQTILYLVALIYNDKKVHLYALPLALLGTAMSLYHYLLQIGIVETSSCSTVGFSISCSETFTTTFGFVTIPMMAFAAFSLISISWITYLFGIRKTKKTKK